jgi:TonB family protein
MAGAKEDVLASRAMKWFLAWVLVGLAAAASGQEAPNSTGDSGFVLGVNTYFDFGPPFDYYEIFVVSPTKEGSKVEKLTLTPPANKCYAPEKTEYAEKDTTDSVRDLLAGVDPCKITDKDLKKERNRKKAEANFSGAILRVQVNCQGQSRMMEMNVLERDWFLAHPGTPKDTNWSLEVLGKLRQLTGPSVMEKPMFAATESWKPLAAEGASVENLKSGKYDGLFPEAKEKASEIYLASQVPPPKPTVRLISSAPLEPAHFVLPPYPPIPWITNHEGEVSVVLRLDNGGNVSSVEFASGSPLFQNAVRDAVMAWKFPTAPATMGVDEPQRETTVRLSFRLNCAQR